MKAIFETKFVSDKNRNGQEVEIIKKLKGNILMYEVRFPDGEVKKVYSSELNFGY